MSKLLASRRLATFLHPGVWVARVLKEHRTAADDCLHPAARSRNLLIRLSSFPWLRKTTRQLTAGASFLLTGGCQFRNRLLSFLGRPKRSRTPQVVGAKAVLSRTPPEVCYEEGFARGAFSSTSRTSGDSVNTGSPFSLSSLARGCRSRCPGPAWPQGKGGAVWWRNVGTSSFRRRMSPLRPLYPSLRLCRRRWSTYRRITLGAK